MARYPRYELYSLNTVLVSLLESLVYTHQAVCVGISEKVTIRTVHELYNII
jgi:hypothetical protein